MILAIDQGTTSTRAALFDRDGQITRRAKIPHRQSFPQPGWVEHDAQEIWQNTRDVIAELGQGAQSLRAIGIANQGETVLVWHRQTGKPFHPALVWQDTRTQAKMDELGKDPNLSVEIRNRTGLRLDSYFSASKIRWLLDHIPESQTLIEKNLLCVGTIDTWLIWNLTRGKSFRTDVSTAARTLLFNIRTLAYDPFLLELFGIPKSILPEVVPTVGEWGIVEGLGKPIDGTPILASLVDQPAALFGQGALASGRLKATYGTGCFLYLNTGTEPRFSENGLLTTVAWQREEITTYALDGGIFAAGSVIEWMKGLGILSSEKDLDRILAETPRSEGVVCVPALAGLAAPYWHRNPAGAFLGMGLHTNRNHLVRAACEGIAARVQQVVQSMEKDFGKKMEQLMAGGGLTESREFLQLQADILGVPVTVADEKEATLKGAAFLAGRRAGVWPSDAELPGNCGATTTFSPRISDSERNARIESFARAVSGVCRV